MAQRSSGRWYSRAIGTVLMLSAGLAGSAFGQQESTADANDDRKIRGPEIVILEDPAPVPTPEPEPAADADSTRPDASNRIVRIFDFEEQLTNPTEVPLGWIRAQDDPIVPRERPGYPNWNSAILDYERAATGVGSVRLPTRGGGVSLMLRGGVLGVFPSADYLVAASVRTEGLDHARAQIAARLLDQSGAVIPGTESRSPLVSSPNGWQPIAAEVLGDSPDAAFLQIELLLRQPEDFSDSMLPPEFTVWPQDFEGSAWFDDVAVIQLPRVELWLDEPGNLVDSPGRPGVRMLVRDLTGEPLTLRVVVQDAEGRIVDERLETFSGGRFEDRWEPAVERLGWYRATMTVEGEAGLVGRGAVDFAWSPTPHGVLGMSPDASGAGTGRAGVGSPDRARFGLAFDDLPRKAFPELAVAMARSGAGAVSLPYWTAGDREDPIGVVDRIAALEPLIDSAQESLQEVTIALGLLPDPVASAAAMREDDGISYLSSDRSLWSIELTPAFDRFGQTVRRWGFSPQTADVAVFRNTLDAELSTIREHLSRLVPGPITVLPWRTEFDFAGAMPAYGRTIDATIAPGTHPSVIPELAAEWRAISEAIPRPTGRTIAPPTLALRNRVEFLKGVSLRAEAAEFVRRAVLYWQHFVADQPAQRANSGTPPRSGSQFILESPWRFAGGRRPQLHPTPAMAAWRPMIERLADRRVSAELDLVPGIRAILLEPVPGAAPDRGSAMVVWRTEAAGLSRRGDAIAMPEWEMLLGLDDVRLVDIFGHETPIEPVAIQQGAIFVHRFEIGYEPLFIEGVDAPLIRFQAGVALDPPTLLSRPGDHAHELIIENTFPESIRGKYYIVEPGGFTGERATAANRTWRISPRHGSFATPRTQTSRVPLSLTFSAAEEAGLKKLVVDFDLNAAGREYGVVRVTRFAELGLPNARLDLSYRRGAGNGADDILVDARITNTGEEVIAVELFGRASGYPRERRSIPSLQPGETIVRVLPFKGGATRLNGQRVYVGLALPASGGRLGKSIGIGAASDD